MKKLLLLSLLLLIYINGFSQCGDMNPGKIAAANNDICYNSSVEISSEASASGGKGRFRYQWKISANGKDWTDLAGATSPSYTSEPLKKSAVFQRWAYAGTCAAVTDGIYIHIKDTLESYISPTKSSVCYNNSPGIINGYLYNSLTKQEYLGVVTYSWESSPSPNGPWKTIPGETASSYIPPALTDTTYYRRKVSEECGEHFSNVVKIEVYTFYKPGSIGTDLSVCENAVNTRIENIKPPIGSSEPTYQWQTSQDNITWTDIQYETDPVYLFDPTVMGRATYFRRMEYTDCGNGVTEPVKVTVIPSSLRPGEIDSFQSLCYNDLPAPILSKEAATGGTDPIRYEWEYSLNDDDWFTIPGAASASYQPGSLTTSVLFRRIAIAGTGECSRVFTNEVFINVWDSISAGTIGGSQHICKGEVPAQLTSITPGTPAHNAITYKYQWQSSPDSIHWTDVPYAEDSVYTPGPTFNSTYYRRVIMHKYFTPSCPQASNAVLVSTAPEPFAVTIPPELPQLSCNLPLTITPVIDPAPADYNYYAFSWYRNGVLFSTNQWVTLLNEADSSYIEVEARDMATCKGAERTGIFIRSSIPSAYAGADINITAQTDHVVLQGKLYNAAEGYWQSSGTGSFIPSNTSLSATYHLSDTDTKLGRIYITLTPSASSQDCGSKADTMTINNCSFTIHSVTTGNTATYIVTNADSASLSSYRWMFDDGMTMIGKKVTRNFASEGSYIATVKYTREDGTCTYTVKDTINISSIASPVYNLIGVVRGGNARLDNGLATLYKVADGNVSLSGIDSISNGNYSFANLTPGTYILLASPSDSSLFKDLYLSTYYEQAVYWRNARFIELTSDTSFNFYLTPNNPADLSGSNVLKGVVTLAELGQTTFDYYNPLPNAIVTILSLTGGGSLTTTTDEFGRYNFGNLSPGMYMFNVNYPGTRMRQIAYTVTIEEGNYAPVVANIQMVKVSDVTGINSTIKSQSVKLYPNPVLEQAYIELPDALSNAKLKVFNASGELVMEQPVSAERKLTVETGFLPSGLYILQIQDGEKLYMQRFTR